MDKMCQNHKKQFFDGTKSNTLKSKTPHSSNTPNQSMRQDLTFGVFSTKTSPSFYLWQKRGNYYTGWWWWLLKGVFLKEKTFAAIAAVEGKWRVNVTLSVSLSLSPLDMIPFPLKSIWSVERASLYSWTDANEWGQTNEWWPLGKVSFIMQILARIRSFSLSFLKFVKRQRHLAAECLLFLPYNILRIWRRKIFEPEPFPLDITVTAVHCERQEAAVPPKRHILLSVMFRV